MNLNDEMIQLERPMSGVNVAFSLNSTSNLVSILIDSIFYEINLSSIIKKNKNRILSIYSQSFLESNQIWTVDEWS